MTTYVTTRAIRRGGKRIEPGTALELEKPEADALLKQGVVRNPAEAAAEAVSHANAAAAQAAAAAEAGTKKGTKK